MSQQPPSNDPSADFGANAWLVDEMYEQYKADKNSVDSSWWPLFAERDKNGGAAPQPQRDDTTSASTPNNRAAPQSTGTDTRSGAGARTIHVPTEPGPAPAPQRVENVREPVSAEPVPAAPAKQAIGRGSAPLRGMHRKFDVSERRAGTSSAAANPTVMSSAEPGPDRGVKHQPLPAQMPTPRDTPAVRAGTSGDEDENKPLKGASARIVKNMDASLTVPTATSFRDLPAKVLIENRTAINNHLQRNRGGKVSFTHLIGYAVVRALDSMPDMNKHYTEIDGKPTLVTPAHVNFGLAIDLPKPDGSRSLVVPNIKGSEQLDFFGFWSAYEELVSKARHNKLTVEDFAGTTISLTNPGGIGTSQSVPRLMEGQSAIIGVGAMTYPAEWMGASEEMLSRSAISKIMTVSSTYDHRVIQGAASGEFLRTLEQLLLGADDFYDKIYESLRIPYEPIRWSRDRYAGHEEDLSKTVRVQQLIHAYRVRGHLLADIDPLEYRQRVHPDLQLSTHKLTIWDLDREFATGGFGGKPTATLREILEVCQDTYCRTVGVEYMHIQDPEERRWMQNKVEVPAEKMPQDEQMRILRRLNAAEAFETFLQTKYIGQKRFSLEGSESTIVLLDQILLQSARQGMDEVCIGMPHRGRLNVLANIAGKSYAQIFSEFDGARAPGNAQGSGDVKYHLGTEGMYTAESGEQTKVYLAANPSHLEAVNPVLEGIVRAKQDRLDKHGEAFTVLPILMHGDAAFAGQGVVMETMQLSQLRGYRTGGTIHVIVNNQIGFTTAPSASRSSVYSSDLGRTVQAPIFRVNGDDPEAVVRVATLAYEFRQKFASDVIIDLISYRRRGHNEGDDPSMTQPLMYGLIEAKRSTRMLYTEALIGRGDITQEQADAALKDYQSRLEQVFTETREAAKAAGPKDLELPRAQLEDEQTPYRPIDTAISVDLVHRIGDAWVNVPDGFKVHKKLVKVLEARQKMSRNGNIDWAMGELLAFGSLLTEGTPVRLTGQDTRRGTFTQRHAVLIDHENAEEWTPLLYMGDQARLWTYDSMLSEFACMGFEYGYSVERPDALVAWEAQFGDFANGGQTIIDEFISSSEQKWNQRSSVVLLLPHGYEGQGPDHSSARIERYLQLCAQDNMSVAHPSTPASYFHLLRYQAYQRPRKPLIVATPKQLLRRKEAVSQVEDFTTGSFRAVLPDALGVDPAKVRRVIVCSGRVYYDLAAEREKRGDDSVAIIRMERLYPLPDATLAAQLAQYPNAEIMWVQDEPVNQGAWTFLKMNMVPTLAKYRNETRPWALAARPPSASPATGSAKVHAAEEEQLVESAFA